MQMDWNVNTDDDPSPEFDSFEDCEVDDGAYDEVSEISGDCNESQPCRGDEVEIDYDFYLDF